MSDHSGNDFDNGGGLAALTKGRGGLKNLRWSAAPSLSNKISQSAMPDDGEWFPAGSMGLPVVTLFGTRKEYGQIDEERAIRTGFKNLCRASNLAERYDRWTVESDELAELKGSSANARFYQQAFRAIITDSFTLDELVEMNQRWWSLKQPLLNPLLVWAMLMLTVRGAQQLLEHGKFTDANGRSFAGALCCWDSINSLFELSDGYFGRSVGWYFLKGMWHYLNEEDVQALHCLHIGTVYWRHQFPDTHLPAVEPHHVSKPAQIIALSQGLLGDGQELGTLPVIGRAWFATAQQLMARIVSAQCNPAGQRWCRYDLISSFDLEVRPQLEQCLSAMGTSISAGPLRDFLGALARWMSFWCWGIRFETMPPQEKADAMSESQQDHEGCQKAGYVGRRSRAGSGSGAGLAGSGSGAGRAGAFGAGLMKLPLRLSMRQIGKDEFPLCCHLHDVLDDDNCEQLFATGMRPGPDSFAAFEVKSASMQAGQRLESHDFEPMWWMVGDLLKVMAARFASVVNENLADVLFLQPADDGFKDKGISDKEAADPLQRRSAADNSIFDQLTHPYCPECDLIKAAAARKITATAQACALAACKTGGATSAEHQAHDRRQDESQRFGLSPLELKMAATIAHTVEREQQLAMESLVGWLPHGSRQQTWGLTFYETVDKLDKFDVLDYVYPWSPEDRDEYNRSMIAICSVPLMIDDKAEKRLWSLPSLFDLRSMLYQERHDSVLAVKSSESSCGLNLGSLYGGYVVDEQYGMSLFEMIDRVAEYIHPWIALEPDFYDDSVEGSAACDRFEFLSWEHALALDRQGRLPDYCQVTAPDGQKAYSSLAESCVSLPPLAHIRSMIRAARFLSGIFHNPDLVKAELSALKILPGSTDAACFLASHPDSSDMLPGNEQLGRFTFWTDYLKELSGHNKRKAHKSDYAPKSDDVPQSPEFLPEATTFSKQQLQVLTGSDEMLAHDAAIETAALSLPIALWPGTPVVLSSEEERLWRLRGSALFVESDRREFTNEAMIDWLNMLTVNLEGWRRWYPYLSNGVQRVNPHAWSGPVAGQLLFEHLSMQLPFMVRSHEALQAVPLSSAPTYLIASSKIRAAQRSLINATDTVMPWAGIVTQNNNLSLFSLIVERNSPEDHQLRSDKLELPDGLLRLIKALSQALPEDKPAMDSSGSSARKKAGKASKAATASDELTKAASRASLSDAAGGSSGRVDSGRAGSLSDSCTGPASSGSSCRAQALDADFDCKLTTAERRALSTVCPELPGDIAALYLGWTVTDRTLVVDFLVYDYDSFTYLVQLWARNRKSIPEGTSRISLSAFTRFAQPVWLYGPEYDRLHKHHEEIELSFKQAAAVAADKAAQLHDLDQRIRGARAHESAAAAAQATAQAAAAAGTAKKAAQTSGAEAKAAAAAGTAKKAAHAAGPETQSATAVQAAAQTAMAEAETAGEANEAAMSSACEVDDIADKGRAQSGKETGTVKTRDSGSARACESTDHGKGSGKGRSRIAQAADADAAAACEAASADKAPVSAVNAADCDDARSVNAAATTEAAQLEASPQPADSQWAPPEVPLAGSHNALKRPRRKSSVDKAARLSTKEGAAASSKGTVQSKSEKTRRRSVVTSGSTSSASKIRRKSHI